MEKKEREIDKTWMNRGTNEVSSFKRKERN